MPRASPIASLAERLSARLRRLRRQLVFSRRHQSDPEASTSADSWEFMDSELQAFADTQDPMQKELPGPTWRAQARQSGPVVHMPMQFTFAGRADARDVLGNAHALANEMARMRHTCALLDVRPIDGKFTPDLSLLLAGALETLLPRGSKVAVLHAFPAHQRSEQAACTPVQLALFTEWIHASTWLAGSSNTLAANAPV